MKWLSALAVLFLYGCAEDPEGARTVTGRYLGQSAEVEIDPTAGRLEIPEGLLPIQSIVRQSFSDRVVETYNLTRSLVMLQFAWQGGFTDYKSDRRFRRLFAKWKINGTPLPKSMVPDRKGGLTFAEFSHFMPCLAFARPIGEPVMNIRGGAPAHEGSLHGFVCRDMDHTRFVETVTDLIRGIRVRE